MSSKRRKKNQSRKAFLWSWCTSFTNQRIEKARNRKTNRKDSGVCKKRPSIPVPCTYDPRLEAALHEIEDVLGEQSGKKRWYAMKYFERDQKVREDYEIAVSQQKRSSN